MFWRADVQGYAAHIALMHGTYHLGYDGITHFPGEGREFLFRHADHFGHQWNAGTGEDLSHRIWSQVATCNAFEFQTVGLAVDDLTDLWHIDAIEFQFG